MAEISRRNFIKAFTASVSAIIIAKNLPDAWSMSTKNSVSFSYQIPNRQNQKISLFKREDLDLDETIHTAFPLDEVFDFKKGSMGRDVVHTVISRSGQVFGKIIWETARTKHWSQTWVDRIKEHQRQADAEVAVLVSFVLPHNTNESFICEGNIWVVQPYAVVTLAEVLRKRLIT